VAVAQAQADVAARTHERFVFLRDQKSVSAQEFDEVEAKFRAAQASLEQARARQKQAEAAQGRAESEARAAETVAGYARVVAPFSGVVVSRMVEKGSLVTPGTPLFVVEDVSRYRLEVSVPASLPGLARGASARVALDALPGKEFQGKVVELEAGADPASHTVQAKVELPADPAIRSGLFGRAWFRRGERKALLVPRSAVVERGQLRGVFVVDAGGIAQWRLVTLGAVLGDRMEVLSGIGEGERIVADPGVTPLDGKRIAAGSSAGEVGR
jgi:multidrug efflux system membrane fusion protein